MKIRIIGMMLLLAVACPATAGEIYVSPLGNDRATGERLSPFRTLQRALREAREWRRLGDARVNGGITITMLNGEYVLDEPVYIRPEDSGTQQSPTIIKAEEAGKASISGGISFGNIESSSFGNTGSASFGNTASSNLGNTASTNSWKQEGNLLTADAPTYNGNKLWIRQLWVNGRKALRASQFGEYTMQRMTDFNTDDRTITIPAPQQIQSINDAPGLEIMVHQRWATAILRVKDIKIIGKEDLRESVVKGMAADGNKSGASSGNKTDTSGNKSGASDGKSGIIDGNKSGISNDGKYAVLSFYEPESRLEFEHPWPQPIIGGEKGNSSYMLMNARQFLDEPGEWWQDPESGRIYYMPRPGETAATAKAIAPAATALVVAQGTRQEKITDIIFDGITFEYAAWTTPATQGHVTLQGGFALIDAYKLQTPGFPWSSTLENQAWIRRPQAAVSIRHAERLDFRNCTFQHLAATALDYPVGDKSIRIANNTFTDIGGTAIMAGSFGEENTDVHKPFRADDNDFCERIDIIDNSIVDATNEDWGAVGIAAGYVRHTNIKGNTVKDVNYSGICVGWGWTTDDCGTGDNHIDNNTVDGFAKQLYDAGGVYTLSNQPGSTISGNTITNLGNAPYATNDRGFYIYLDEATDGYTITGNKCDQNKFGDNKPGPNVIWRSQITIDN